ncbi:hypothetical protein Vadar_007736 [Vaccinium darrowii]|uniref:Uncharacterized protein n=1 Tax=Vaccinium darrowii TaxID=229202 RepID=A0ACB7X8P0_9ERIC|nr:hypothetical protein Vadar_007736 [Vaccinium darrowii]
MITLKIHHGGVLTNGPNRVYVGGKIEIIDGIDSDCMSLLDLEEILQFHLGYAPPVVIHFRVPGLNLDVGLVQIRGDAEVISLITALPSSRTEIEESNSDGSTEDEQYSDGSYAMSDDDALYETYVDDEVEAVGLGDSGQKNRVLEENEGGEDIVLSDEQCDTENESPCSSSDSENDNVNAKPKNYHFKKFRRDRDMEDLSFQLGMKFSSTNDFKDAIRQHAIKHQRNVKLVKNDKLRVRAKCQKGCPWEVYAMKMLAEESYQVRTYRAIHKCRLSYTNRNINSGIIAKRYMEDLRINPSMPITAFKERVRKEMKCDVSKSQLYRAKRKSAMLIYGNDIEQYGNYCEELRRSNPGSTVVMDAPLDEESGQPRFNRLYICFAACKSGFIHGCRKLVGVDGCHLKGPYIGQLLTAIGVDANNAMYPISYAVVETENKETWMWFFELLRMDLAITPTNEPEFTFINDRQKGLLPALAETFPSAEHRHCCKHLLANFMKKFRGLALEEKFWKCAKSTYVASFQHAMTEMNEEDTDACKWLGEEPPRYWSRSHFKELVKCDMVCNNMCEAFNKAILEAREKSIIEMLEWIRSYLVNRRVLRREWIRKLEDPLLSNIYWKLEMLVNNSYECIADWCGELNFQVRCPYGQYTVDLACHTCSCRKWDMTGMPCTHAIAAIQKSKQEPESFIHQCYSKEAYAKAYNPLIMPINGHDMWPKTGFTPVLPPLEKRKHGRPKKQRRRDVTEYINKKDPTKLRKLGQNSVYCRKCGQHGHNRRTCIHGGDDLDDGAAEVTKEISRGRGSSRGLGRGRGSSRGLGRGRGLSMGLSRGRGGLSGVEGGTTSGQSRGASTGVGRGRSRGRSKGLARGRNSGMGMTRSTQSEVQTRGVTTSRGMGRATIRGHHAMQPRTSSSQPEFQAVNVPSNYDQATQSSQVGGATTTDKSTERQFCKGQKFGNLSAL